MRLRDYQSPHKYVGLLWHFVDLYHSEYSLSIVMEVKLVIVTTLAVVAAQVGIHVRNNSHVDGGYKVASMLFIAKAVLR